MIKVVCFDLDGVFFEPVHDEFFEKLAKALDVSVDFINEVLHEKTKEEDLYSKMKKGEIEPSEYWDWLWDQLNVKGKFDVEDYLKLLSSVYRMNNRAADLAKTFRQKGIKTAVVTSNWPDNILMMKREFNLSEYFDIELYSFDVGVLKDDPKIFQVLVDEAGVKPEEIFYSDDNEEALEIANSLGIKTYLYKNFEGFKNEIKNLGIEIQ